MTSWGALGSRHLFLLNSCGQFSRIHCYKAKWLVLSQVNGLHGAVNIVNALKERGVELEFVLDEGLAVLDGIIGGLHGPAAL